MPNKSKETVREKEKKGIIQQHEDLSKSVSNQKISLAVKNDLLDRLDEISEDIVKKRPPKHEDLERWESQLAAISKALEVAIERWENSPKTTNNSITNDSGNFPANGGESWAWASKEFTSIISKVYSCVLKYIIIAVLGVFVLMMALVFILKYMIPLLICNNIPFVTTLLPICKPPSDPTTSSVPENRLINMPSVPTFVEKTTELAERLSDVDVSAPNKLTEVKISLIYLKTRISHSNIEEPTRQILTEKFGELKTSVESTTDSIHGMLAGFGGTLSKLEIYTKYALTYLTDESSALANSSSSDAELVIGNFEEKIQSQFQNYVGNIEKEINRIIHIAEDVHAQLLDLDSKYETVNDILFEAHGKIESELKIIEQKILNEGYLVKLYRIIIGNGELGKAKHQHNLGVLQEFKDIIKLGIIDVNNVIDRLKRFKAEAAELKSTVTEAELAQSMSLNIHMDILKSGIERLHNLKQRLDGRMKHKQIDHLDNNKDDL